MDLNAINVGKGGTFQAGGEKQSSPADVDAIFEAIITSGRNKVVVHFHGGLIKESAGFEIAAKMTPLYLSAGAYPVSFVWETGLLETVTRNLNTINQTRLFQKILKYVIKFSSEKLGGGFGKGPGEPVTFTEIERELEKDDGFKAMDESARGGAARIDADNVDALRPDLEELISEELEMDEDFQEILDREAPGDPHLDPEVLGDIRDEEAKGLLGWGALVKILARVVLQVIRRFVARRDHGFYPTVVEEVIREIYLADLGEWVWGGMKFAAENMWKPNAGLSGSRMHAGTYFLDKVREIRSRNPGLILDLVGHSAGSIAICHMLGQADTQGVDLGVRNILFLAPACTTRLFVDEIVKHPDRFDRFRMYTMRDDFESKDRLVPGLYTRSLLYFISGALEGKPDVLVAGMQRFMSGEAPYDASPATEARAFIMAEAPDRLVLADTTVTAPGAPDGFRSTARKHGDFDDDTATRDSLKHVIESP